MKLGNALFILLALNLILLYNADFSRDFVLRNLLPANALFMVAWIVLRLIRIHAGRWLGEQPGLTSQQLRNQRLAMQHQLAQISQAVVMPDDIRNRLERKLSAEATQISNYAREHKQEPGYVLVSFVLQNLLSLERDELEYGSPDKAAQIRGVYQRVREFERSATTAAGQDDGFGGNLE